MHSFLWWIGAYNALGSLAVLVCLRQRWGETLLGKWLQVLAEPYDHGAHGALWVWWAATANLFLGLVMMAATRWPATAQREVTWLVLGLYVVMLLVAVASLWSPRWRRKGVAACLVLWPAQIAWGAVALLE